MIENTYQVAKKHLRQMFILNKKSHIWRLATDRQRTQRNQHRELSLRKLAEFRVDEILAVIYYPNLAYLDKMG